MSIAGANKTIQHGALQESVTQRKWPLYLSSDVATVVTAPLVVPLQRLFGSQL